MDSYEVGRRKSRYQKYASDWTLQNNTLALITQSVHDAENDDDTTGFGTIFAFYEKSEREDILKHVNLEVT